MKGIDSNQRYKSKIEGMKGLETKGRERKEGKGIEGKQRIRKEGKHYGRKEKNREGEKKERK